MELLGYGLSPFRIGLLIYFECFGLGLEIGIDLWIVSAIGLTFTLPYFQ